MSTDKTSNPSFSPSRRWRIGLDVVVRTVLVLAAVVMLNWLGARFYHRFYLSETTKVALSSRTLAMLGTLTNRVDVILYYDKHDPANFYADIQMLLGAYHDANKNIVVRTVDYTREPAEAMKVKDQYALPTSLAAPNSPPAKDLIIFACGERHDVVPGEAIIGTKTEQKHPNDPDYEANESPYQYRRKPVTFNGEVLFTSKIYSLAQGHTVQAYFLQRHGEPSLVDNEVNGYRKFALALAQNDIALNNLDLTGTNDVPADCSLLVVAAPTSVIAADEVAKLQHYLDDGGKMLVMLNYFSRNQVTGMEALLQRWNVNVLPDYVKDGDSGDERVVIVRTFNPKTFVAPLSQLALEMVLPRAVLRTDQTSGANAPQIEPLITSSENATLATQRGVAPRVYPLAVAVQQKPAAGVALPRGNPRLVVLGDSFLWNNQLIEAGANRDFLNYTANWLCDRGELLTGISPRPVTEFRLLLSKKQTHDLYYLLLGALPGGVLVFGWLVWLIRRK